MAGRRNRSAANKRKIQRRRKNRRRPSAPSSSQGGRTLGRFFAKGVRNVTSAIFGSPVANIVDFLFRAVGLTTAKVESQGTLITAATNFTGLGAKFFLTYVNIITSSRAGVRTGQGFTPDGVRLCETLSTDYTDARVQSLTISVMPTGAAASRQGEWTLAFTPLYSPEDYKFWSTGSLIPDMTALKTMPYVKTAAASRPLSLTIRPQPFDGVFFQTNPINTAFGVVFLRWEQTSRATYTVPTAETFSTDCIVTGTCELRRPYASAAVHDVYSDYVIDLLSRVSSQVLSIPDKTVYLLKNDDAYACADTGLLCTVRGNAEKYPIRGRGKGVNLQDYEYDECAGTSSYMDDA